MVTRDPNAIITRIWAAAGDVAEPTTQSIVFDAGWDADYSMPGGSEPEREVANWLFRALFALAVEINRHGLLVWDSVISYVHPCLVFGSDRKVYISVQDSTNNDPVTDTGDNWTEFAAAEGEVFSSALMTKLENIEFNAKDDQTRDEIIALIGTGSDQTAEQIKTAYESNADTNAFTNALLALLNSAAQLNAPAFTGNPTFSGIPIFNNGFTSTGNSVVPTQSAGNNSTRAANTRYVDRLTRIITGAPTQADIDAIPDGGQILVRSTTAYVP